MRSKEELAAVKELLEHRRTAVLPITDQISHDATAPLESLALSHGLQMTDAPIAVTAQLHLLPLLTGNVKHFAAVDALNVDAFVP